MVRPQISPQTRQEEPDRLDQDPLARLVLPVSRSGWAIAPRRCHISVASDFNWEIPEKDSEFS